MMREIRQIIIHCSATMPHQDIGAEQIREWHKMNGWEDIGYHYVIRINGIVEKGRPLQNPGAHARGWNGESLGICLVGGLNDDGQPDKTFNGYQLDILRDLLWYLTDRFPAAEILGHRDLPEVNKQCPCFDVKEWLDAINFEG